MIFFFSHKCCYHRERRKGKSLLVVRGILLQFGQIIYIKIMIDCNCTLEHERYQAGDTQSGRKSISPPVNTLLIIFLLSSIANFCLGMEDSGKTTSTSATKAPPRVRQVMWQGGAPASISNVNVLI